jgi:hypothetical protein
MLCILRERSRVTDGQGRGYAFPRCGIMGAAWDRGLVHTRMGRRRHFRGSRVLSESAMGDGREL